MDNIKNKIALVTGGANGLGFEYVEALLRNNAKHVAFLDQDNSAGEDALEKLKKQYGQERVLFLQCDVSNTNQFKDCVKKVVDTFHGLDIFINNAGVLNDARWEDTVKINIMGVITGTLAALDYMSKQKGGNGGTIVNISSVVGLSPASEFPIYSASKCAVYGFSTSIQGHYKQTGVRIMVLCPGATATSMLNTFKSKALELVDPKALDVLWNRIQSQPTEHVANAMVQLIQKGENGAVWVSEQNKPPYSVTFPHYSSLSVPV